MTNTFNDIKDKDNRTWNRCAMLFNLTKDHGTKAATKYAAQFTSEDRNDIGKMFERIKTDGYESVRASINRQVQANAR
jgi:hypothetical protein